MHIHFIYILIIVVTIAVNIWMNSFSTRLPNRAGVRELRWMNVGAIQYMLVMAALSFTTSQQFGYFLARFRFLGLSLFVGLGTMMIFQFTDKGRWLTTRKLLLLWAIPAVVQVIMWTPGLDKLLFEEWSIYRHPGYSSEIRVEGIAYMAMTVWELVALLFVSYACIQYALRVERMHQRALILTMLFLLVGMFVALSGVSLGPDPGLRLSPIAIGIITGGFGFAVWRYNLLSLVTVSYDEIVETVHDAVIVTSRYGRVANCNAAAERLLGVTRIELLEQLVEDILPQLSIPLMGPEMIDREYQLDDRTWQVSSLPLSSRTENSGRILTIRDISIRKKAEREASEYLRERERMRIVNTFIHDAGHEFRNPVTAIKSSVYLLGRVKDPEKIARLAQTIDVQTDRLARLIDDLEKMNFLDNAPELSSVSTNIGPELAEHFAEVNRLAASRQVTLDINVASEPIICNVDMREITHAVTRILDNAIHYSTAESVIRCSVDTVGKSARIIIADSGGGMDTATVSRATERFYRKDSSRTTAGFGLGLPIAKAIAELHGGTLEIQSEPAKGTTVTITLPLEQQSDLPG
jgi:PAS domain S-box-containing protein